jgi:hypothetical protein
MWLYAMFDAFVVLHKFFANGFSITRKFFKKRYLTAYGALMHTKVMPAQVVKWEHKREAVMFEAGLAKGGRAHE